MSASMWKVLGIGKTDDKSAIRRAYAAKLKALDLDRDVAAYAALRQARDAALLHAARSAAPPPSQAPVPPSEDVPGDDPLDNGTQPITAHEVLADFADEDLLQVPAEHAPYETGPDERVVEGLRALAGIMFPDGNYSDAGFTMAEFQVAQQIIADLLEEARTGRLELAHAVDHHLAQMMAEGWPRSAALIEEPAAEFQWLDEAGSLDERPALRFLNDRIRGMRFTENVQQPDHHLHKAWVELCREGEKLTFAQKRAVQKDDIRKLLNGIRQHFPEVEGHLNRERVDMWDRRLSGSGGGDWSGDGMPFIAIGIGLMFVLRVVAGSGPADNPSPSAPLPEPPPIYSPETFSDPQTSRVAAGAVVEVVGEDMANRLQSEAVSFRLALEGAYFAARNGGGDHAAGIEAAHRFARDYALAVRHQADFAELVAIDEMLRLWLQAAERDGRLGADCPYRPDGNIGSIVLDSAGRSREQALYRQLLDAGLLQLGSYGGSATASIPGPMVEAMIQRSGLPDETVIAAIGDNGHAERCRVVLAALDVILERPGDASADLLRVF